VLYYTHSSTQAKQTLNQVNVQKILVEKESLARDFVVISQQRKFFGWKKFFGARLYVSTY
jgi:hypothetical protein